MRRVEEEEGGSDVDVADDVDLLHPEEKGLVEEEE